MKENEEIKSHSQEEAVMYFKHAGGAGFWKNSEIAPGGAEVITIVDGFMNKQTKYPIKGLDYCWRFMLDNGKAWDCSSFPLATAVVKMLFGPDPKKATPCTVKISKSATTKAGKSPYTAEQVKTTS